MMNEQAVDILYVANELIIACLPSTAWPIFSLFLRFCCYYFRLKSREISLQNMRNSQNIGHIVLGTV